MRWISHIENELWSLVLSFFYPLNCWHILYILNNSFHFAARIISDLNFSPELEERTKLSAHYTEGWEKPRCMIFGPFAGRKTPIPTKSLSIYIPRAQSRLILKKSKACRVLMLQQVLNPGVPSHAKRLQHMFHQNYSQTPGNMWAARCSYVAQLKDPDTFDRDMLQVQDGQKATMSKCQGTDRYAAEHWVYSHPAAPCDLDSNVDYTTALQIVLDPPKGPYTKELKKAPRFEVTAYHWTREDCKAVARLCRDALRNIASSMVQNRQQIGGAGFFSRHPEQLWEIKRHSNTAHWRHAHRDKKLSIKRQHSHCETSWNNGRYREILWNILKQELVLTLRWVAEWLSSLDILTLLPFSTLSS